MKVYDIVTPYNLSQTSCVVAPDMATAERLFNEKYGPTTILEIRLHSNYVIVAEEIPTYVRKDGKWHLLDQPSIATR